eukprot:1185619-Prorocentrum_minimum.AAC.2
MYPGLFYTQVHFARQGAQLCRRPSPQTFLENVNGDCERGPSWARPKGLCGSRGERLSRPPLLWRLPRPRELSDYVGTTSPLVQVEALYASVGIPGLGVWAPHSG